MSFKVNNFSQEDEEAHKKCMETMLKKQLLQKK